MNLCKQTPKNSILAFEQIQGRLIVRDGCVSLHAYLPSLT
jgi:hypothetical protein